MPLEAIPYQPLAFDPTRPTDCFADCDEREYCMPFIPGDPIYAQFKQTPCNPSITCDGDFSSVEEESEAITDGNFNSLNPEELTNGNFTGNANGWTLNLGWAYNSNNIRRTSQALQSFAFQYLANPTGANEVYKFVFTVSNYVSGTVMANLSDGFSINVDGAAVTANGTYTHYIKVPAGMISAGFHALATFAGDIDTVSVRRIAATWDFGGDYLTGWGIDTNGFAHTIAAGAYNNCSNCPLTDAGDLTPNTSYDVTVEVEDGDGVIAFELGGTLSPFFTLNGGAQTITFTITSGAGTDFVILPGVDSKAIISDVSAVEQGSECWDFDIDQWTVTTDSLCKTPGSSDVVTNAAVLTAGVRYQIKITVNGMSAGYIQMTVDFSSGDLISTDGTFVQYFEPTLDSALSIFVNNLFDGCISNVEIFELKNDFVFEIRDLDGNQVAIISDHDGNAYGRVRYDDDYITVKFNPDEILDINDRDLPYSCYKIWAYDNCEIQYEEIIADGEFVNPIGLYWSVSDAGGCTINITAGQLEVTKAAVGDTFVSIVNYYNIYPNNVQIPLLIPSGAHNYRMEFDIISNDDTTGIQIAVLMGGQFGTFASTVGHHSFVLNNYDPEYNNPARHWAGLGFQFTGTSGSIVIDNVTLHRIEPYDVTYTSQCIKYAANFPCTKYIKASCYHDSFGFKFTDDVTLPQGSQTKIFELAHRVEINAGNDSYPESTSDYLFSTGTKSRNFSQSENSITVVTGLISRDAHATIRLQRASQFFEIGEPLTGYQFWFCLPGDYNTEWNKNLRFKLASARFEIQLKETDTKFFRNV